LRYRRENLLGVADIKREGTDVTIVSFGKSSKKRTLLLTNWLKKVSCEIVDLRTVRPMDETILTSVRKTNRLVVLEEAFLRVLLRDYLYCSRACF
jgi:pyruvate dehydrogenase E1 component beta subunit